jgi:hypothetical protein
MKKTYQGNCCDNPFHNINKLQEVIDDAKEISMKTFLLHVDIDDFKLWGYPVKEQMLRFPNDFVFYSYKNKIYFFTHSCIEYFFW